MKNICPTTFALSILASFLFAGFCVSISLAFMQTYCKDASAVVGAPGAFIFRHGCVVNINGTVRTLDSIVESGE